MEELCGSFSISSYGLQTLQRVTADTEDTFALHKRRWTTSHALKTYHRSRLGICTKYDQKAPAPRNNRFASECMMATTRIEFNTDLYCEASPSPIPSSPLSSLEDCNCETNHPVYFMTDKERSLSEGSPTNINMPPTSKSNWAPTNEEFIPVFMSHLDPNHSESEFGGVSVTDQCSSNSSKCVAASHHEPLLSSLLYMSDMRDQSFRMVNSILDQDPLNLSNESGLTSPAAFSSPTSSFMPDFLDEDKMRKEDLTRSQLQVQSADHLFTFIFNYFSPSHPKRSCIPSFQSKANAQGMHPINSYLGSEESQYYGHHSSERSEVDDFPAFNATGYPASITRPFHPSTHEPSIQQSSFQSSFQYLRARELDNEAYGGGEMPANSFTPPSNYNNYPEALLHEDLYNQRRSTEQRSYSLPAQLREVTYDPKVERSQSFSGQTVHEQQSQYGRQSTYSPQPQSFRRGTEEMKYGDLQHQAQSQVYSQLVAEAQQQVRSKMILTQRRAQDQHLQQQQFQQLHRLHTQQLKQAKQRGLEAKQQSTDVFVQMPRLSYGGSVYQVQFKCNHRYVVLMDSNLQGVELGAFVIVEADRGEDLGVIVHIAPRDSPLAMSLHAASNYLPPGSEEQMKKILRVATLQERADLPRKAKDEMDILAVS